MTKKMNKYIKYPQKSSIDIYNYEKDSGIDLSGNYTKDKQLHKDIHNILVELIKNIFKKNGVIDYKLTSVKNGVHFEYKIFPVYLGIYIQGMNITYVVRTNTINSSERIDVCYFAEKHMACYPPDLFDKVLIDFYDLIYECSNLEYAFEGGKPPFIPRQTYFDDLSWFCNKHEHNILKPRHYYRGWINYKYTNDPTKWHENDFDKWLDDIKKGKPDAFLF